MSATHRSDDVAPPPPWWVALLVSVVVLLAGAGAAEGVVRWADGGAFAQLDLFVVDGAGRIGLAPGTRTLRRPGGETSTISLAGPDERATPPVAAPTTWLAVGDSQVLGLGVDDGATFAARATVPRVRRVRPIGVPGWGVEDALADLDVGGADGVIVVVNQANDWDEAGRPMASRYEVRGGWLLPRGAAAWRARFFGSPFARVHLLHDAMVALSLRPAPEPPVWARDPAATDLATARIGAAIRAFADTHPGLAVIVAYLPLDAATSPERAVASPFAPLLAGRPAPSLAGPLARAVHPLPVVDLTDALRDPSAWLAGDYHLSPVGHAAVAQALGPALIAPTSGGAAP